MDISKIKKEDFQNMKVWELCSYIRAANPDYKFSGYLPKVKALAAAESIYDELHSTARPRKPIPWHEYFMGVARLAAQRSKDPKTQVGAVIVNPENNHIISVGYNGFPYGTEDKPEIWASDEKHKYVVHAEANAILNATTSDLQSTVMYITQYPCNECAKLIAQKRISTVIYDDDKYKHKEAGEYAAKILNDAFVLVMEYSRVCKYNNK